MSQEGDGKIWRKSSPQSGMKKAFNSFYAPALSLHKEMGMTW